MAILAGDIKKNVCLRLDDGKIYVVIDFLHVKPGKGNTVMRTKLRNVEDGRVLERTWIVSAKLDDVQVSHQQFQYLFEIYQLHADLGTFFPIYVHQHE